MRRSDILDKAKELTTGDRLKSYGDPLVNHTNIAIGWEVILGCDVSPHQVALCMAWLKLARLKQDEGHVDSYIDGAAYMALAGELQERENEAFFTTPEAEEEMATNGIYSPAVTILDPEDEPA